MALAGVIVTTITMFGGARVSAERYGGTRSEFEIGEGKPSKEQIWSKWKSVMEHEFGADWDDTGKSRHLDAKRCLEWSLARGVTQDSSMEGGSDDDMGRWGCLSAMVREAAEGLLGKTYNWKSYTSSSVLEQNAEVAVAGGRGTSLQGDWEVLEWEPTVCQFVRERKSRARCQVRVYASNEFAKLRLRAAQPNGHGPEDLSDDLQKSIDSGPVVAFSPGAGKSGSTFARTWDDRFKIKVGLKHGAKMKEPENLMELLVSRKHKTLYEHLAENPDSLLNRVYGIFRVKFDKLNTFVLIMMDATYGESERITKLSEDRPFSQYSKLYYTRYDLKGTSRNQDKKQDEGNQFTLINGDFEQKEGGLLHVNRTQCEAFRQAVQKDAAFLNEHEMIDYSLFVGVVETSDPRKQPPGCRYTPGQPFCLEGFGHKTYTFSLIDYLNDKNWFKTIESGLFGGKFKDYSKKIVEFSQQICPVNTR